MDPARALQGDFDLISSEALIEEVSRDPNEEKRTQTETFLSLATESVPLTPTVAGRARILIELGFGTFDALHLASAEIGKADALLSTDDKLVKRANRHLSEPSILEENPVSWVQRMKSKP